ncbi:glucosaminidase domain-containing protein [Spongiimicrobium salis]|uniref:glucosaminidase domain-containing protein n=1 Tax=Spongiimicrobium salis TaxID=1667022 RepID=UPI00374CFA12
MKKSIGILIVLSIFFTGCGSKRRAATLAKARKKYEVVEKKPRLELAKNEKGETYPLPKDSGKFVEFPIASVEEYIDTFSEIAQSEMKSYGIPASITLAQGILESGFGRSTLTRKTNNHFGIKCHKGWTGEYELHDDDRKGECFRKYNHPIYSFRDHSTFLSTRSRYAFLFEYRKDDYKRWAKGLRQAGYATDKRYPQKLIAFIEKYELYKYDKEVLRDKNFVVKAPKKEYAYATHIVAKGDTLYSLSRKYFISVPELKELNNLKNNDLAIGQELIIKSENKKK